MGLSPKPCTHPLGDPGETCTLPKPRSILCFAPDGPGKERAWVSLSWGALHWDMSGCWERGARPLGGVAEAAPALLTCSMAQAGAPVLPASPKAVGSREGDEPRAGRGDRDRGTCHPSLCRRRRKGGGVCEAGMGRALRRREGCSPTQQRSCSDRSVPSGGNYMGEGALLLPRAGAPLQAGPWGLARMESPKSKSLFI